LPGAPGWSETFLQAHVDKLAAPVRYQSEFPIDIDATFAAIPSGASDRLTRNIRILAHRVLFNRSKRSSLLHFLRSHQIKVVLAEYGDTGVAVLSACQELRLPLVVHFHGADAYLHEFLHRYRDAYKSMFGYASAVVAVSRHMAKQLVQIGAPEEKVIYNPYGVEIEKFKPALPVSEPRVIAVGRFVEKKAPYLTILAFQKVLERMPNARLVMVGGGLLKDACSRMVQALHLENAVEFAGVLGSDEIATLMQKSRVFVQHSLTPESGDMEGTPLAVLEAAASGLPVVATCHAGIMDVVVHGETGYLVPEGDVDSMADYLFQMLNKPELARGMGAKGRARIDEQFSVERSIGNLRRILEETVRNSGQPQ